MPSMMQRNACLVTALLLALPIVASASAFNSTQESTLADRDLLGEARGVPPETLVPSIPQEAAGTGYFEPNLGQWHDDVLFASDTAGYRLFLTSSEAMFVLASPEPADDERHLVRFAYESGAPAPKSVGQGRLDAYSNYYLGNDPTRWASNVPRFQEVIQEDVWPGIDLRWYHEPNKGIKFDALVAPKANPMSIGFRILEASDLALDATGRLVMQTGPNQLTKEPPITFTTDIGGFHTEIFSRYALDENGVLRFILGPYDANEMLTIDPLFVSTSTYLGKSRRDLINNVAVARNGDIIVVGSTDSSDFPVENGFQEARSGANDAFLTRFSSDGQQVLYSTFIGGSAVEPQARVTVDANGNTYLTGQTQSADFPTQNAIQSEFGGGNADAFVLKLSVDGSLQYSSYLGGSAFDTGNAIVVDSNAVAYVVGVTESTDMPTRNAFQSSHGGARDGFVMAISSSGSSLVYGTYLGRSQSEGVEGAALGPSGSLWVAGGTNSDDFHTTSDAYQSAYQGGTKDAFLAQLTSSGNLQYSSFFGGSGFDAAFDVATGPSDRPHLVGKTNSGDLPIQSAFQASVGGVTDAFLARFSSSGTNLQFSSYAGGSEAEEGHAITVTGDGRAVVTGATTSPDFPLSNPFQDELNAGTRDGYVLQVQPDDGNMEFSTYLGGSNFDSSLDVAPDYNGGLVAAGYTRSSDFPLRDPYQDTYNGRDDGFLTIFGHPPPRAPISLAANGGPNPGEITLEWEAPADDGGSPITEYRIYRSTASGGPYTFVAEAPPADYTYNDQGLPEDSLRYYKVSAVNENGEGDRSAEAVARTPTVPGQPTEVTSERGTSVGEIDLRWKAPATDGNTTITTYHIYRGAAPGALSYFTSTGNVLEWTDSGLPNGAVRYYAVSAENAVGEGPRSSEVSGKAPQEPQPPIDVETIRGPDVGQITVQWTDNPDDGGLSITETRIWEAPSSEGPYTHLVAVNATMQFVHEGLPNGAIRCYRLASVNAAGQSDLSESRCGQAPDVPTAPRTVQARSDSTGSISLTWNRPSSDNGMAVTGYTIYRTTVQDGESVRVTVDAENRHLSDQDLIPGVRYYYTITATNGVGEGPASGVTSARAGTYPGDSDGDVVRQQEEERICATGLLRTVWELPGQIGPAVLGHCEGNDLEPFSGLDADADLMPDVLESFMCTFLDNSADSSDGICVNEDWGPPPGSFQDLLEE